MKRIISFVALLVMGFTLFAQQQNRIQTVTIQTNGTCEQCKKIMMENIPQWAGVKECSYNMKNAKVTITFDSKNTNVEKLREGIRHLGYDADNVKANAEARAKLPACCTQTSSGHSGCGNHGSAGGCGGCGHHH